MHIKSTDKSIDKSIRQNYQEILRYIDDDFGMCDVMYEPSSKARKGNK